MMTAAAVAAVSGIGLDRRVRRADERAYMDPVFWSGLMLALLFGLAPLYRQAVDIRLTYGLTASPDLEKTENLALLAILAFHLGAWVSDNSVGSPATAHSSGKVPR